MQTKALVKQTTIKDTFFGFLGISFGIVRHNFLLVIATKSPLGEELLETSHLIAPLWWQSLTKYLRIYLNVFTVLTKIGVIFKVALFSSF